MAAIDEARPSGSPRCCAPRTVPHDTAVSSGRRAAQFNVERYSECVTEFHPVRDGIQGNCDSAENRRTTKKN